VPQLWQIAVSENKTNNKKASFTILLLKCAPATVKRKPGINETTKGLVKRQQICLLSISFSLKKG